MAEQLPITVEEALKECPVALFFPQAKEEHVDIVRELGLLGTRELLGSFWKVTTIQMRRGELSPTDALVRGVAVGSVRRAMRNRALEITQGQLVRWITRSDDDDVRPFAEFIGRPFPPNFKKPEELAEFVLAMKISIATIAKTGIDASIHVQMQDRLVGFEETLAGMGDKTGQSLDNCREKLGRGELLATRGRPPKIRSVADLALE